MTLTEVELELIQHALVKYHRSMRKKFPQVFLAQIDNLAFRVGKELAKLNKGKEPK